MSTNAERGIRKKLLIQFAVEYEMFNSLAMNGSAMLVLLVRNGTRELAKVVERSKSQGFFPNFITSS
ncbi:MAG: hypothetical protein QW039_03400 [Fervidicoccaceae archaeon]